MRSHIEFALNARPIMTLLGEFLRSPDDSEKDVSAPTRTYLQDTKAMAGTAVDIIEGTNAYTFYADMPGLSRTDIQVQVEDNDTLTIRGKRKREESVEEGEKFIVMERRPAKFFRKFVLPSDANVEAITATCVDGVLTVRVPKRPSPEPEQPKTIEVKVN